jgi:hypothetical protein
MWRPEAVLVLRRDEMVGPTGSEEAVSVGRTSSPTVVRALVGELMDMADREAAMWSAVDDTLGAIAEAECERLEKILEAITPGLAPPTIIPMSEQP